MKGVSLAGAALAFAMIAPSMTAEAASGIVILHRPFSPHERIAPLERPRRDHHPRFGVEADAPSYDNPPDSAAAPPPAFAPDVAGETFQPASFEPSAPPPASYGPRIIYVGRQDEPPPRVIGPRVVYGDAYSPLSAEGPSVIYGDEASPRTASGPKLVYGDAPANPQPTGPKVIYADPLP